MANKASRKGAEKVKLFKRSSMTPLEKVTAAQKKAQGQRDLRSATKAAMEMAKVAKGDLDAILSLKKNLYTWKIAAREKRGSEATAIWLASDWHVGEKVTHGQTNGINKYNPTISKARGEQFFQNALKLTKMVGRDTEVKTIVLALLGDFITNHLHLDAVENNYLAPVEETLYAQAMIASGIKYVLAKSKYELIVPCQSGNHGRTTKFSHFGSENGHSLEFFMYSVLRDYFKDEPRVKFIISEGAHTYVEVYGRSIRFLHGHDLKYYGGVGGLTIPANKAIAAWDKAHQAYLTCFGHFHQRFDGGNFVANGSMIGYNAYALSIKASAEPPSQQLFFIDKRRGKTGVFPVLFE